MEPIQDPQYHRKYLRFTMGMLLMLGIGLGVYQAIHAGYYPAAFIGSRMVSAHALGEAASSVIHYYEQAVKTYGATDPALQAVREKPISTLEGSRATLDKMIENELVAVELESSVGRDLARLVAGKIDDKKLHDPQFEHAVTALYGLTPEHFRQFVLEPQAREEILQSVKFATKTDEFKNWLTSARKGAKVVVFAPDLFWDGEKVTVR